MLPPRRNTRHRHSIRSPIPLAYTSRPVLHAAIPATARIHSDTLARHITPVPLAFAPTHSPAISLPPRRNTRHRLVYTSPMLPPPLAYAPDTLVRHIAPVRIRPDTLAHNIASVRIHSYSLSRHTAPALIRPDTLVCHIAPARIRPPTLTPAPARLPISPHTTRRSFHPHPFTPSFLSSTSFTFRSYSHTIYRLSFNSVIAIFRLLHIKRRLRFNTAEITA